jgi:exodeoxyribonuclease VII small subunit
MSDMHEPATAAATTDSFEQAQKRLAAIVVQLEAGDLPLEQSLALFEEGVRLTRTAQERLDHAERRVEELLGIDASGKPITRDFQE